MDAGLGVCLFFAFGMYLSVFLVASVGVDVLGRGAFVSSLDAGLVSSGSGLVIMMLGL